jgi:hypothetical protein
MWHNLEKRTFLSFCIKHRQIPAAIDFESALICGGIWSTRQFWHVHICQQMKTRRRLHEVWTCMRATTKSRLKTWRNHKTFTNTIKDAHFEESTFVSFLAFRCSLLAALAVSITAQVLSRVSKLNRVRNTVVSCHQHVCCAFLNGCKSSQKHEGSLNQKAASIADNLAAWIDSELNHVRNTVVSCKQHVCCGFPNGC